MLAHKETHLTFPVVHTEYAAEHQCQMLGYQYLIIAPEGNVAELSNFWLDRYPPESNVYISLCTRAVVDTQHRPLVPTRFQEKYIRASHCLLGSNRLEKAVKRII